MHAHTSGEEGQRARGRIRLLLRREPNKGLGPRTSES